VSTVQSSFTFVVGALFLAFCVLVWGREAISGSHFGFLLLASYYWRFAFWFENRLVIFKARSKRFLVSMSNSLLGTTVFFAFWRRNSEQDANWPDLRRAKRMALHLVERQLANTDSCSLFCIDLNANTCIALKSAQCTCVEFYLNASFELEESPFTIWRPSQILALTSKQVVALT